jgi:hypothetical protein
VGRRQLVGLRSRGGVTVSLKYYREEILKMFTPSKRLGYYKLEYDVGKVLPVGDTKAPDWPKLKTYVDEWWKLYKEWEKKDSLEAAYHDQRLTVKGTSTMDDAIEARVKKADETPPGPDDTWKFKSSKPEKFDKPVKELPGKLAGRFKQVPEQYKIVKTNLSIVKRLNPENFNPPPDEKASGKEVESRKTELGLHDLSAGLMNRDVPISKQQFKTPGDNQIYVFMPLSAAGDQAVFQNINELAKANRVEQPDFYKTVRDIRSKMTRISLAAEHDMATSFILVGQKPSGRPKFKFTLGARTDVSVEDKQKGLLKSNTDFGEEKVLSVNFKTGEGGHEVTTRLREARRNAAINFQELVLGKLLRYGEVVVAYRKHAGDFPVFAKFDTKRTLWIVGTIDETTGKWAPKKPEKFFLDQPAKLTT